MADDRVKLLARFIEPLRVKPGTKVEAGQGFRPRLQGELPDEEGRRRDARGRGRRAGGVPGAAGRPGHLGCAGVPAGPGRRRQGRHDPARDERRQPAGRAREQLQGAIGGGTGPRLPVALCAAPARPGRDRHLQPVPLRGGPGGPGPPRAAGPAAAAVLGQGQGGVGPPLRGDQRLGALPGGQRIQDRQAVPEPVEGRAADPVPAAAGPAGQELEVLGRRRQGAPVLGRLPDRVLRDAVEHVRPSGRRGM